MKALKKTELRRDTVTSTGFHVGIELELTAPCDDGDKEHDSDACYDAQREYFNDMSTRSLLIDCVGIDRHAANSVENYFDSERWIDDYMSDWSCDGDCGHYTGGDGSSTRDRLESDLEALTGNKSFKVVEDGSVKPDSDETDAEVCWNYFASKETLKDNEKILDHLKDAGCSFNSSCGLHINLNNYLNIPKAEIPTSELAFLFSFVAKSRKDSSYCNRLGLSAEQKYSMIYHQGDRLEFRFFSPTLEADKLNHYVTLANTVYRRLAGKKAKLPKNTAEFLRNKMIEVNGLTPDLAQDAINKVNLIQSVQSHLDMQEETKEETYEEYRIRTGLSPRGDLSASATF